MNYDLDWFLQNDPQFAQGVERLLSGIRQRPVDPIYLTTTTTEPAAPDTTSTLRRLAVAALRGAGELPAAALDLPAYLGLPGTPEKGAASRAWHAYTQELGGLEDTTGEMLASMLGGAVPYALAWPATSTALAGAAGGAGRAAQAAGRPGAAKLLETAAKSIAAPKGIPQWMAREAAIATSLYPIVEAPRPEELKAPLPAYMVTAALGGALVGKLAGRSELKAAQTKAARDALAKAAESMRVGAEVPAEGVEPVVEQVGDMLKKAPAKGAVTLTSDQQNSLLVKARTLQEYYGQQVLELGSADATSEAAVSVAKNVDAIDKTIKALESGVITKTRVDTLNKAWETISKDEKFRTQFAKTVAKEAGITPAAEAFELPKGKPSTMPTVEPKAAPLRSLSPTEHEDLIKARAIQSYWGSRSYQPTKQGVGSRSYTEINERKAAAKADEFARIVEAIEQRRATPEDLKKVANQFRARTKKPGKKATELDHVNHEDFQRIIDQQRHIMSTEPVAPPATAAVEGAPTSAVPAVPEVALPVHKGPVPGSPAWNQLLREQPKQGPQLQAEAKAYWDGLAERLTRDQPEGVPKVVYQDDIRALSEMTQHDVPLQKITHELRSRGVVIGNPIERILDNLNVVEGSKIDAKTLLEIPSVQKGEISPQALIHHVRKRGAEVVGGEVEFNAGLPLSVVSRRLKLLRHKDTRPTFEPVQTVSSVRRSLSKDKLDILPNDIRTALDDVDQSIAGVNKNIERHILVKGHPAEMSPNDRKVYNKLCKKLESLAVERDKLREPVDIELGNASKGKYTRSVLNALNKSPVIDDAVALLDDRGRVYSRFWTSPLKGDKVPVPDTPTITTLDESIWKSQPSVFAASVAPLRFVLREPVMRPLRNAYKVVQTFESEFEKELFGVLKPILKDSEALHRVTMILEGHQPKYSTEAEYAVAQGLRNWYNRLFKEFGIDSARFLEDYAPRIRESGSVLRAFGGKPPEHLKFFAEMERTAKHIAFPTETNALTSALAYLRLGARKKFIQPALDQVKPLRTMMHPDRQRMLDEVLNHMLHRPIWEERLINGAVENTLRELGIVLGPEKGRLANEVSSLGAYLYYMGALAGNTFSAVKNLTQTMLAVLTVDPNPAKGLRLFGKAARDLHTGNGQKLLEHCWVLHQRQYLEGFEQLSSQFHRFMDLPEKYGMFLFKKADEINVSMSYMMKVRQGLEQGLPVGEAIEAANTFASLTQYLYGFDSAMLYKNPAGRVLGVLTSWPVNFMHLLQQSWKYGGSAGKKQVANAIVGMTLLTGGLSKLTGLDFSSAAPFEVTKGWLPISFVFGTGTGTLPLKMLGDVTNLTAALATGTPAERDAAWKKLQSDAIYVLPGGVQGRRIYRGIRAAADGGFVYEEHAGMPYKKYEMEPGELPRSFIGPTVAARERRREFETQERARQMHRHHRDKVIEAYMKGDADTVRRYQREIARRGGRPVTATDLRKRLIESQKTALERQAESLPRGYHIPDSGPGKQLLQAILNQSLRY